MVTKVKQRGRRFRNKFGMTQWKFGVTLIIALLFSSCSFYTDLRDNPRFKDGVITAPTSFTGTVSSNSNGVVTLEWSPVEGAKSYKIYYIKWSLPSKMTEEEINKAATLCYTFEASHVKDDKPRLEISNLDYYEYYFFIKTVSTSGGSSKFCKNYVYIDSKNKGSGVMQFREL